MSVPSDSGAYYSSVLRGGALRCILFCRRVQLLSAACVFGLSVQLPSGVGGLSPPVVATINPHHPQVRKCV